MMKKFLIFSLIFLLLILSASGTKSPEYMAGEVIVKLKHSPDKIGFNSAGVVETGIVSVDVLNSKYKTTSLKKLLEYKNIDKKTETSFKKHGLDRIFLLKIAKNADVAQAVREFNNNSNVEYAESNYIVYTTLIPNDPDFSKLYGLHNTGQTGGTIDADIDAPEAWDLQTGSNNVLIAVIDTGVDYNHADLAANMWTNPNEVPNNGLDDDSNGFVDDARGWDFYNNDNDPFDDHGHGTHVSGTIGAVGNNNIGVAGVNWNVKIMPIKFLGSGGSGTTAGAISSVQYATLMGVHIMSNSWGGGGFSQALKDTISAANDAGILFVAAAGNTNNNNDVFPFYPASYNVSNVVAVAATDHNDLKASFSSYGANSVHLGAPGVSIFSTVPKGSCLLCNPSGYRYLSGTSMATPHVSGVAGLIKAQFPALTSDGIKARLLGGVDLISSMGGITITGGRLNAYNALENATPINNSPPIAAANGPYVGIEDIPVTFDGSGSFDADNDTLTYKWDFGDGSSGIGVNPSHAYKAGGVYTVTLIVNDGKVDSAPSITTATITEVNDAPVAKAGEDKNLTDIDENGFENATLNGTLSVDSDGFIVSYEWKEGAIVLGNTAILTTNFAVGTHTINLTVTDNGGLSASDDVVVTVNPKPIQQNFTLFFDDFSSGFAKWQESNEFDWDVEAPAEKQPNNKNSSNLVAHADNCTSSSGCRLALKNRVNLSGYKNATLTFLRYVDNDLDNREHLRMQFYNGTWKTIVTWTNGKGDDDLWHSESFSLSKYLVSNFNLRFVSKENTSSEDTEIDDVHIIGTLI